MNSPSIDPTVNAVQPEEPKENRGRKKGTVLRYSRDSVKRLAELGFDPIEKLVKLYEEINTEIAELQALKTTTQITGPNGEGRRYSSMAHSALLVTQQKLINDLMRFGYARVPETVNVSQVPQMGLVIELTPKGGVFDVDSVVDVSHPKDDEDDDD